MSKFKVGDKVLVKYIPNVENQSTYMAKLGGIRTIKAVECDLDVKTWLDGPYTLEDCEVGWCFNDDSLEKA